MAANKKGKYTIWIESAATGNTSWQADSYEWADMKATTYFHFTAPDGRKVWMNDFTIRNLVVEIN
jgi:hypothetical protein